ncbi:hypothetical protein JCM5350_002114 [Sporobolomyces pararoseus]
MTLPNQLIHRIFEYVYTSLCHHAAHLELDFPLGSKFVFSNFSLVCKTWHSLSLPFLIRHFDGQNVEPFTRFVKKYDLFKSIKSIYLNPTFKGWPDPDNFLHLCEECEQPEAGARDMAMEEQEEDVEREVKRWLSLLKRAGPTLSTVEIGSRRRRRLERGPWYGDWHYRYGDEDEDTEGYGPWDTAPALDLREFFKVIPVSGQVHSVRLNLPDEGGSECNWGTVDEQFASTISSKFPNLKHYTLHSHSKINCTSHSLSAQLPPLQSLRIWNVWSDPLGLSKNLRPMYLLPSAATLRYLELQVISADESVLDVSDLFEDLRFPLLEELHLDSHHLSCTQSDFFDRFPRIESASIPLNPTQTTLATLPLLPASLRQLTLSCLLDTSLVHLAQYLRRENLSRLTRLVLQSWPNTIVLIDVSHLPHFETSETPTTELATIIQICSDNRVELCYSMGMEDEDTNVEASEELSEDENWDFDGEDGVEFKELWSNEKQRAHDIG